MNDPSEMLYFALDELRALKVTASAVSSLPVTISNAKITTDMVCMKAVLSNPAAKTGDWTVNTDTAGTAVISGTINGSTNIDLYLEHGR